MNHQSIMDNNNKIANEATDIVKPDELDNFEDISQGIRTKEDSEIARVVVDRLGCIGARSCVVVAEKLFEMDDQDLAYVVDPNAYTDEEVKLAAEACPVLAIHLYKKDGSKIFPQE